jgi:Ca2+-transporting ATPase
VDAIVENPEDEPHAWRIVGRPVEVAIIRAAGTHGVQLGRCVAKDRIPFDSKVKYSAALLDGGHDRAVYLGAPEILLNACDIPATDKGRWQKIIEERTATGERLLGLASVPATRLEHRKVLPPGLTFTGLLVLRDPLRKTAKGALERIRAQGVRTAIVTGDHQGTALSIARELGMPAESRNALTGQDLTDMSESELVSRLKTVSVFARVTPEQKLTLAHLYQRRGGVVAMTGDGVNDAPALKAADIGIAVGSGTEVAKSAADLVILDDNYETIVKAIEQGRMITDNIRRVIIYLVSHGLDELILIGGAVLLGIPLPITALQIIYINFFTDSFPAVAFALEERRGHTYPPANGSGLLTTKHRLMLIVFGTLSSGLLFCFYLLLRSMGLPDAHVTTMVFTALSTYTLLVAFSLRRLDMGVFSFSPFGNRWLCLGVGFGLTMAFTGIYTPFMNRLLGTVPLPFTSVTIAVGVSLFMVGCIEAAKWLFARASKP